MSSNGIKVVILAGGRGTRISEESVMRPKPLIEIGNMPILWHIMKIYSFYGFNDFIICAGYKGEMIKSFFLDYRIYDSDLTVDLKTGEVKIEHISQEPWKVTIVNTGLNTLTGGRIKKIHRYIKDDPYFMLTYGDGVANVDIPALIKHHKERNLLATMTAVRPPARYGSAVIKDGVVHSFTEKRQAAEGLINGGYFVLSPRVCEYIRDDNTSWEFDSLEAIAIDKQLTAFVHEGFWQPMDTLREKEFLNELYESGEAPWVVWKNGHK